MGGKTKPLYSFWWNHCIAFLKIGPKADKTGRMGNLEFDGYDSIIPSRHNMYVCLFVCAYMCV